MTSGLDMLTPLADLIGSGALAAPPAGEKAAGAVHGDIGAWVMAIPFLPLLGSLLCVLCAIFKVKSKLPAWITVAGLAGAFVAAFVMFQQTTGADGGSQWAVAKAFDWINFQWGSEGQALVANFSFYVDSLTCLWMLFVTGLATLIALYASEYMSHDKGPGYCRFFFAFNLFVFSMACLVMGDNLLLLFLGWEGVGLCSYLLIGYFYKKESAVAAAKKAFIMNRIGDLGLSLGVMLTFVHFGTLEYAQLFHDPEMFPKYLALAQAGDFASIPWQVELIPILLAVGAFGKSAQFPLYVWLPDAMEGPTPVSALIHAATMVTAGVYLVARFLPVFAANQAALGLVILIGAFTALLSATIAMRQYDIKRIMAYSTVSQLGYMFVGVAVLAPSGGAFHVFTHAFFKATLFLCCGAVMHGFAGQLDLRKLSGVMSMKGWLIVSLAMLVGCLNLAGVPFTAGYFSKDMILAESFVNGHAIAGWVLLITAGLTAYYTFRVFFRVFVGPTHAEPGEDLHPHEGESMEEAKANFHAHAPGWAINLVLGILLVGSILVAFLYPMHWADDMIATSTAGGIGAGDHTGTVLGMDPHKVMYYVSAVFGVTGILIAAFLHGPKGLWSLGIGNRSEAETSRADALVPKVGPVAHLAERKWLVDELYHATIAMPLRVIAHISHALDRLLVDGLVNLFGWLPRLFGRTIRPAQNGLLHSYAIRMVGGVGVVVLLVVLVTLL